MPPVQIPTIQRMQPQNELSVGRIEVKPIDATKGQAGVNEAIGSLAETSIKIYAKYEEQSALLAAKAAGIEFHQYLEAKLEGDPSKGIAGIKHFQGDPTAVYQQFDTDSINKQVEIQARHGDSSLNTRSKVQQQLAAVSARFYDRKTVDFGNQITQYGIKTTAANGEILHQNTVNESGLLNSEKLDTIKKLDNNLQLIVGNVYDGAELLGLPTNHPSVQFDAFSKRSGAIVDTVKVLTDSKKLPEARMVMEKYQKAIDASQLPKVIEHLHKATIEEQGQKEFSKVRNLPPKERFDKLNQIKDDEVRKEALENSNTFTRQIVTSDNRQQEMNFNEASNIVYNRERSGKRFLTVNQMEKDPQIKTIISSLDLGQVERLRKLVERPEKSDPKVEITLLNKISNGEMLGMTAEQLFKDSVGLNDSDRHTFRSWWHAINTDTESESRLRVNYTFPRIEAELIAQNIIPIKSLQTTKHAKIIAQYQKGVLENSYSMPKNLPDLNKYVTEWVAKDKEVNYPESTFKKFLEFYRPSEKEIPLPPAYEYKPHTNILLKPAPTGKTPTGKTPTGKKSTGKKSDVQWIEIYKKENSNKNPKSLEELEKFKNEYKGNK